MDSSLSSGHNTDTTVIAGNGNDTLTTAPGLSPDVESSITAGNGNDILTAGEYSAGPNAGDSFVTISLGNGNDTVTVLGSYSTINVGNGNNTITSGGESTITLGNGNDTVYVGMADTITVGKGSDAFIFNQTTPGTIGAVTINHFDPGKDLITIQQSLATNFGYSDNIQGNAVITIDGNSSDTITLVGVHSSALHASDFHFV
jgi:Ca2+-binding RTX toxin-like protein